MSQADLHCANVVSSLVFLLKLHNSKMTWQREHVCGCSVLWIISSVLCKSTVFTNNDFGDGSSQVPLKYCMSQKAWDLEIWFLLVPSISFSVFRLISCRSQSEVRPCTRRDRAIRLECFAFMEICGVPRWDNIFVHVTVPGLIHYGVDDVYSTRDSGSHWTSRWLTAEEPPERVSIRNWIRDREMPLDL